ncbi:33448_t:CDS:2 [Racocetra persica]|uniref:33448_t:CDS:1 n=1 Tax=Racocetra persica TaxID=160502 RepID=A0ACA9LRV1_9GLOM|nr:33448_t:CDS:2 [Racocetra persica]
MSITSSKAEQHSRASVKSLKLNTKRDSTIEESLKTYQLLEALRSVAFEEKIEFCFLGFDYIYVDRQIKSSKMNKSNNCNNSRDTTVLSSLLSNYNLPALTSPNSISGETNHVMPPSPLTFAVQCATMATIEFIITNYSHIIDVNQRDQHGNTALHYAAKSGRIDVLELLLKQKYINDTITNNEGKQPVEVAKNREVTSFLEENRSNFVERTSDLFQQYVADSNYVGIQSLFQDPRTAALVNINHIDSTSGSTLLHDVARKRDLEMVQFCLDHGADVSIRDRKGKFPADVTKDDKIKTLLKQGAPATSLVITSLHHQPPMLKGYLHKWTNYASGYKSRWFVLENGMLSYFKNQDDAGNSCRGSINMKIAKISIDSTDRLRFDIIGKGSVRYHLRANNPREAQQWVVALTQSSAYYEKNDKGRRQSVIDDSISDETRIGRSLHKSESHADTITSADSDRDRSRSPSNQSIDLENVPNEDSYRITISSTRAQLELQNQLLDSLSSTFSESSSTESKESTIIDTFSQSLRTLHNLVDDVLRMTEERDVYWNRKLEKELEAKRLWEESMRLLAMEKSEMEKLIQQNVQEQKMRKKQLKAALAESHLNSPSSPSRMSSSDIFDASFKVADDSSNLPDTYGQRVSMEQATSILSMLAEDYDNDEFYDALDNNDETQEVVKLDDSEIITLNNSTTSYISSSYCGYPEFIREKLPIDESSRPEVSLWAILKNSIGKDLSKITLPVYFNEPTSMLQRMAEDMEYGDLLDIGARQKGSTERILYVAAFAMSNYSSTVGRIAKPFNPLLGETYEYVRRDKAFRYISEQVSHHPPISACYCESMNFDFFAEVDVKSKFWGKSFEIHPQGVSHVRLKVPKEYWPSEVNGIPESFIANGNPRAFSEHYSWKKVTTCVNNLILGTPWIDHYGDMIITNHLTGDICVLTFKARGWRGKDAFEIRGYVKDSNNKEVWEIAGRWNERLVARRSDESLSTTNDDLGSTSTTVNEAPIDEILLPSPTHSSTSINTRPIYLLWKRTPLPEEPLPFNLTQFAATLNDLPDSLVNWIAPTDSRFRPDQRAMESGLYDLASSEKVRLEEKQRAKRKKRENGLLNDHEPSWFTRDIEPDTGEKYWKFNCEYWKERDRTGKEKSEGIGEGKWNIPDDDIF